MTSIVDGAIGRVAGVLPAALAAAEQNNSDAELARTFEDIREEISVSLRKLLKDTPAPSQKDLEDLAAAVDSVEDAD